MAAESDRIRVPQKGATLHTPPVSHSASASDTVSRSYTAPAVPKAPGPKLSHLTSSDSYDPGLHRYFYGDYVLLNLQTLSKKVYGKIRSISLDRNDPDNPDSFDVTYGIHLEKDMDSAHDGQPPGSSRRFFRCPRRRGILVDYSEIAKVITRGGTPHITVGDYVKIRKIGRGQLEYVGCRFESGVKEDRVWYGVNLKRLKNATVAKKYSLGMNYAKGSAVRLYEEEEEFIEGDGGDTLRSQPILGRSGSAFGTTSMRTSLRKGLSGTTTKSSSFWRPSIKKKGSGRSSRGSGTGLGIEGTGITAFSPEIGVHRSLPSSDAMMSADIALSPDGDDDIPEEIRELGSLIDDSKVRMMFKQDSMTLVSRGTISTPKTTLSSAASSVGLDSEMGSVSASAAAAGGSGETPASTGTPSGFDYSSMSDRWIYPESSTDVLRKKFSKYYTFDEIEDQLGEGGFGIVFRCTKKATGPIKYKRGKPKFYAVKRIAKARLFDEDLDRKVRIAQIEQIKREIQILFTLKKQKRKKKMKGCQYIVHVEDVYEELNYLYIVTNMCTGGDLLHYIAKHGSTLSERIAQRIMKQVLQAMSYVNELKIAHLDLKPDNILFVNKKVDSPISLIDFGMSQVIPDMIRVTSLDGATPHFVAPEMLSGEFGRGADVWSLGVILFLILFGYTPFFDQETNADEVIFEKIKQGFENEIKPGHGPWFPAEIVVSPESRDLVSRMLTTDLARRITIKECLDHPWITGTVSKKTLPHTMAHAFLHFSGNGKFMSIVSQLYIPKLSKDDRDMVADVFHEMDVDGDGEITVDEFGEAMKKFGTDYTPEQIRGIFHSIDIDNSGTVDLHELLTTFAYQKMTATEERMMEHFADLKGGHRTITGSGLLSKVQAYNREIKKKKEARKKVIKSSAAKQLSKSKTAVASFSVPAPVTHDVKADRMLRVKGKASTSLTPESIGLVLNPRASPVTPSGGPGRLPSVSTDSTTSKIKSLHFGAETLREAIGLVDRVSLGAGESDSEDEDDDGLTVKTDDTEHGIDVTEFARALHPEFNATIGEVKEDEPTGKEEESDGEEPGFEHYLYTLATTRDDLSSLESPGTTEVNLRTQYLRSLSPEDAFAARVGSLRVAGNWLGQVSALPSVISIRTERGVGLSSDLREIREEDEKMGRSLSAHSGASVKSLETALSDRSSASVATAAAVASEEPRKSLKKKSGQSTLKPQVSKRDGFGADLASDLHDLFGDGGGDGSGGSDSSSDDSSLSSSDDDSSSLSSQTDDYVEKPCYDFW